MILSVQTMTNDATPQRVPRKNEVTLLIHGLGGTRQDLGKLSRVLANQKIESDSVVLPGHGTRPEDLNTVTWRDWVGAVREKVSSLKKAYSTVHLVGMCMGALLAVEAAKAEVSTPDTDSRLVLLAPPLFLDGWSLPWYKGLRHAVYHLPRLARQIKFKEDHPYGVKNERLRMVLKRKFDRADDFHYPWVPLTAIQQLDALRHAAKHGLRDLNTRTLIIHAEEDELTSLRSARYICNQVNASRPGNACLLTLRNSYHMICIDNDRDAVMDHVAHFLGPAAPAPASIAFDCRERRPVPAPSQPIGSLAP